MVNLPPSNVFSGAISACTTPTRIEVLWATNAVGVKKPVQYHKAEFSVQDIFTRMSIITQLPKDLTYTTSTHLINNISELFAIEDFTLDPTFQRRDDSDIIDLLERVELIRNRFDLEPISIDIAYVIRCEDQNNTAYISGTRDSAIHQKILSFYCEHFSDKYQFHPMRTVLKELPNGNFSLLGRGHLEDCFFYTTMPSELSMRSGM